VKNPPSYSSNCIVLVDWLKLLADAFEAGDIIEELISEVLFDALVAFTGGVVLLVILFDTFC